MSFSTRENEPTSVFIDGPNLFQTAKSLGFDIDFKKLRRYLEDECDLTRIYYYSSVLEDEDDHVQIRPLLDWLDYNGFHVVTKQAKTFVNSQGVRKVKGNMGIDIAVDMFKMADHSAHMILFSGDGDFRPLVAAIQEKGVRVSVVSTLETHPPMIADDLRRQTDHFVELRKMVPMIGRERTEIRMADRIVGTNA